MDERDAAILTELQQNARLTNRQLASRVGLAPSSTLVRTRALERSGVLAGYHARVDLTRIGRGVQAMVAFQVRPLSRDVIQGFKAFALAQPEVLAVYVVAGSEDFLVHVAVPSVDAMHSMLVDRFSARKEVIGFRTSLLYEHTENRAVAPSELDG
ncbi:Lrp/AsnC family transcriptional regulator [Kineosporia sp. NBRC 101731]|uniref:Lrp/AsnC family transcriptional regulator n=1 Tax=Kineosporia sp. NBRC 101731 TaxID=3032199 RepID=UPI0024A56765|nr:Lrp/AsnC family transcriptional regulator [Kineosporia sp. NBRC 101731]GLY28786.1 AsnC family transcriptional regulator [Kineosporia sp. NBRC 101731]